MTYEITRIVPLFEPRPMGQGYLIVAEFSVRFGPVLLIRCALAHREGKGYRVVFPSLSIKVDNDVRNEIKNRVRNACLATVGK